MKASDPFQCITRNTGSFLSASVCFFFFFLKGLHFMSECSFSGLTSIASSSHPRVCILKLATFHLPGCGKACKAVNCE